MIGSPQPAPCLRPLPVKWSHQVQLLPKEPKCIISEIKFNPHTYICHYPHLPDEEMEAQGGYNKQQRQG